MAQVRMHLADLTAALRRLAILAMLVAAITLAAGPAAACLACITLPEKTIADRLIEADVVALAREDPAKPYAYAPVVLLRGDAPPPIPFLVDSTTRHRLAAEPGSWLTRPRMGGRNSPTPGRRCGGWPMRILAAVPAWERDDGTARFAYFADRHDHPDPTVRQLALTELSAAPYALIRTMQPRVSGGEIP